MLNPKSEFSNQWWEVVLGTKIEKDIVNTKTFDKDFLNAVVNIALDVAFYERVCCHETFMNSEQV